MRQAVGGRKVPDVAGPRVQAIHTFRGSGVDAALAVFHDAVNDVARHATGGVIDLYARVLIPGVQHAAQAATVGANPQPALVGQKRKDGTSWHAVLLLEVVELAAVITIQTAAV